MKAIPYIAMGAILAGGGFEFYVSERVMHHLPWEVKMVLACWLAGLTIVFFISLWEGDKK